MGELDFVDVGVSYDYPNIESYRKMGSEQGVTLTRGRIWSVGLRRSTVIGDDGSACTFVTREINTKFSKLFQYNPTEVQMALAMVATDTVESGQDGGGVGPGVGGVGNISASFQLRFTRDTEVYHAENNQVGGRYNEQTRAVFKRIGVQKDIYDLYRVIMGGQDTTDGNSLGNSALPKDMSVSALTGKAYDLASAGLMLTSKPVALQFNEDLIFYGNVSGLGIVYNKFNFRMVPLWAMATLTLEVMQVRPLNSVQPAFINGNSTSTGTAGSGNTSSTPSVSTQSDVIAIF